MSGRLTYIKGDLFGAYTNVVAHGCNVLGAFGSGVAGRIRRLYPEVYTAYIEKFRGEGWKLGQVQFVEIPPEGDWPDQSDLWIANMATQETFGGPGVHADYPAIRQCMETVLRFCVENSYTLAIPKIGAGLANGHWPTIEGIIRELLGKYDVDVTCYVID